jgi:hypothetical protein
MIDNGAAEPAPELMRVAALARMVPALPCGDVDAVAEFWNALGLATTYRQLRPNPYLSLEVGQIALQYYGMPDWDPQLSHSTCIILVPDTRPVHEAFSEGLRALFGRVPISGAPRITRPRERANNGGLSGFSVIDPAGNWVRFSRAPDATTDLTPTENASTTWTTTAVDPLGKAMENAVVIADSHGDAAQGRKVLAGALRRQQQAPVPDRARALAYLVELNLRCDDPEAAQEALRDIDDLPLEDLDDDGRAALVAARHEAEAVLSER